MQVSSVDCIHVLTGDALNTMFDPEIRSDTTIDTETAAAMMRFIRPRPDELSWQAIPWRTSIPEALSIAARDRKPVLLWTMNGNPLGLT